MSSRSEEEVMIIPSGFNNNLLWNTGHIIWVQQILVYHLAGLDTLLPENFEKKYSTGSVCHPNTSAELALMKNLLLQTTEQTIEDYHKGVFKGFKTFSATYDEVPYQFTKWEESFQYNNIHEARHYGFMVALNQVLKNK